MKLLKRITAFTVAAALLLPQAFAAADQKPRDPDDPYASSVTGMFHGQDTGKIIPDSIAYSCRRAWNSAHQA